MKFDKLADSHEKMDLESYIQGLASSTEPGIDSIMR